MIRTARKYYFYYKQTTHLIVMVTDAYCKIIMKEISIKIVDSNFQSTLLIFVYSY